MLPLQAFEAEATKRIVRPPNGIAKPLPSAEAGGSAPSQEPYELAASAHDTSFQGKPSADAEKDSQQGSEVLPPTC